MAIEFDPSTSSYFQTAYSGEAVERPATEPPPPPPSPPPEASAPPPPPEEEPPFVDLPPPSQDSALQPAQSSYPGGLTVGSIVDEVV